MASPAPTATLCQLARQGWPLLVAVLLTLLLGWSALHEGRGGDPAAHGWQAHAEDLLQAMPLPQPPADECPQHAAPAPEPPFDGEGTSPCTGLVPARAALVARIPLWRSDTLRWQLHDPALRLNPGHAPPAPHAS
ncbi:TPA: hypothetical protein UM365_002078 [Stenotrophomonas maltophilia]|jgi:hypothetical protein|uniref:hypothetical protein n=1 Tax=Stenotrophomonas TaxID=40323 RepID=UPI000787932D|nr:MULTISPECIES: hypothetical protein [Stenotrophomonas]SSM88114.1 Uncharacterised protein [Acinetobacter baumannii]KYK40837.1 hypothetical protein AYX08_05070 [Stenotrophomonas maltophilia]MBH1498645.1 hypothetical protein [Stenotrophomonas maltophilia]MBH1532760.1 hypothetical protein [Stenotrophomonas maltophilia]MBH1879030.1 hypothetical protein [Stenotrophomonas maltophilia]